MPSTVATITVPLPPDLSPDGTGASTVGHAYSLHMPTLATDAMRVTNREEQTFTWKPAELVYSGGGMYDYLFGSSPVSVALRRGEARYQRLFPAADDLFVCLPESVKHWTILNEPPRPPADYLTGAVEFGVSGLVGGIPLPPGRHESIEGFWFSLPRPVARDLMGNEVSGVYEVQDSDAGQVLYVWFPAAWFESAVYPVMIDPTVSTSTSSTATAYGNQRGIDRFKSNGVQLARFVSGTDALFRYSADNGATWLTPATGGTIAATANGSIFIDEDDYIHIARKSSADNYVYWQRGTPNEARTAYTWASDIIIDGSAVGNLPDIVAHREGTGWKAHVVWAYVDSGMTVKYQRINITSAGVASHDGSWQSVWGFAVNYTGNAWPSIAIDSNKNLHSVGSTGSTAAGRGVRYNKAPYSAGSWTWGGHEAVTESLYAAMMGPIAVDSLGRVVVVFSNQNVNNPLTVFRRAAAGGWTDISPSPSVPAGYPTMVIDGNDKIHIFHRPTLQHRVYDGSVWTATTLDNDSNLTHFSARRDTTGSAIDLLYTKGSASPYSVESYRITLNVAPSQPSSVSVPNFDATVGGTATAQYNDSVGDAISAHQWQIYRVDTGALVWDTGKVPTSTTTLTIPVDQLSNGVSGRQHQARVKHWDGSDVESPWSEYTTFFCAATPTVTVSAPTGTVNSAQALAEWSVSGGQTIYRVRLYTSADVLVSDTGNITDSGGRSRTITDLANGISYKVSLQIASTYGIWSAETFGSVFSVSFTPPPKPSLGSYADPGSATNTLTASVPASTGTEPPVNGIRFERSPDAGATKVVLGTVSVADLAASLTDYSAPYGLTHYRAVAIGANNTETPGDWTAEVNRFAHWRFIPVNGVNPIRFAYGPPRVSWRVDEDVQVPQTQSRYRREIAGPTFARTAEISATFADNTDLTAQQQREQLLEHARLGTVGYLKSPMGDVWKGRLGNPSGEPDEAFQREQVRLSFRETGVAP